MARTEIVKRLEVPGHRIGDPPRNAGEISPLDGSIWLDHQSLVRYGRVALREEVAVEALAWGWHIIETMKCGRWLMERSYFMAMAARAAADGRRNDPWGGRHHVIQQTIAFPTTGVIAEPGS